MPLPDNLPRVHITYCRQCNWLLRSAWYAQELLTTFAEDLGEVALAPSTGGIFQIRVETVAPNASQPITVLVWDRKNQGGFPDIKQLKQLIRDQIAPERDLGHIDASRGQRTDDEKS